MVGSRPTLWVPNNVSRTNTSDPRKCVLQEQNCDYLCPESEPMDFIGHKHTGPRLQGSNVCKCTQCLEKSG